MWEVADIPKISKSINLLMKMKNVSFILKQHIDLLVNPILYIKYLFIVTAILGLALSFFEVLLMPQKFTYLFLYFFSLHN